MTSDKQYAQRHAFLRDKAIAELHGSQLSIPEYVARLFKDAYKVAKAERRRRR